MVAIAIEKIKVMMALVAISAGIMGQSSSDSTPNDCFGLSSRMACGLRSLHLNSERPLVRHSVRDALKGF
jgi:hypothetical protein